MKLFRLPLLLVAVAVGACAPAPSAELPAPAPGATETSPDTVAEAARDTVEDGADPAPVEEGTERRTAPEREPASSSSAVVAAPAQWWLADVDAASPGAGVVRAYAELLADRVPKRRVVVGVIDSGVEVGHEDLDDVLWVNEGEVGGNGVDDDGNGYVDDVHGWNFIGGPDGGHVEHDTYEIARLVARCRARGEPGTEGVGAPVVACDALESELEASRREARQQVEELRYMELAVERIMDVLREAAGTDTLTAEKVRALTPLRLDVRQAQGAYLQLAASGITPAMISEERRRVEGRLEYGLNPEFDPRPIVGDDYADVSERGYGNGDVVGPRAGHGTGVAGIIAAERDNGIGEDGIATGARIMVLRAVPDGDERDKDVANAIRYAVDNGAHIINMSFGKGHSPRKDAVDAAVRYAEERGVLIVHAAGNAGADVASEPSYPTRTYLDGGSAGNWIAVGASNWEGPDRLAAPFSNYGRPGVDVFAPGVDIRTTDIGNDFQVNSGTSFAAPVVSGLAALLMAYYPELDAAAVRQIILDSATRFPDATVVRPGSDIAAGPGGEPSGEERVPFGELSATGGIVNAHAALRLAEERARKGGG